MEPQVRPPRQANFMALRAKPFSSTMTKSDPNPYQVEHDELFVAINAGKFKYADAENGAIATMSSIMGRMATYSGKVITWDEAMASELDSDATNLCLGCGSPGPTGCRWFLPDPNARQ